MPDPPASTVGSDIGPRSHTRDEKPCLDWPWWLASLHPSTHPVSGIGQPLPGRSSTARQPWARRSTTRSFRRPRRDGTERERGMDDGAREPQGGGPLRRAESAPAERISRRAALGALVGLAWEARALAQTPPGSASPTHVGHGRARGARRAHRAGLASRGEDGRDDDQLLPAPARQLGRALARSAQRRQHPGVGEAPRRSSASRPSPRTRRWTRARAR